ncbi:MAG: endo-1,4-beta-xylanase [Phycisphaerales bacterium]
MLSFAVFDERGPAKGWPLRRAYLFTSADEVPVPGEVRAEDGFIRCSKAGTESAGLALLFPVELPPPPSPPLDGRPAQGLLGEVVLRTSLLPEREEPYLLTLELARHRIMLVLNKLEEWQLFDLPADHAVMRQFEQARAEFTAALVAMCHRENGKPDPASMLEADRASRRALSLAIEASEKLALLHADRQLKGRLDGSLFEQASSKADGLASDRVMSEGAAKNPDDVGVVLPQPPMIGCAVQPAQFSEPLAKVVSVACDFVSMPMRWSGMEPTEGTYAFAKTDKWIEWAVRTAKIPVVGGPLIDFREIAVPEWLYIWEHDYETLRELVYEHIKTVVTRYRRTVTRWTVCSGLHVNQGFSLTLERMMDLTRICALLVRKLQPAAKVQIEISQPWGEYLAGNKRAMPPKLYAEMIPQAGINIDALGLRLQMGRGDQGRTTRDLMALSDLLDRYATLDKPIAITAAGVPSELVAAPPAVPPASPPRNSVEAPEPPDGGETGATRSAEPPSDPGYWRAPWSADTQARWVREALSICAAKPYVHSICWQDLYDSPEGEMPAGGLMGEGGAIKPAATALAELRRLIRGVQRAPAAVRR